jgi:hypothetical protein
LRGGAFGGEPDGAKLRFGEVMSEEMSGEGEAEEEGVVSAAGVAAMLKGEVSG